MKCAVSLLILISLIGCTHKNEPYRTALLGKRMSDFDPTHISEINEVTLTSQICGRLTAVDEALNIEGDIADSWDISDDRKIYTFTIRQDRHFLNQNVVGAEDVKFSLERAANDKSSIAASWTNEVKEISIPSPNKVRVELKQGNPRFLYTVSHPRFCILDRTKPFAEVGSVTVPNSSGAYQVSAVSRDGILLRVSTDFQDKAREKEISVRFLDQQTATNEFAKGNIDDLSFYLLGEDEINVLKSQPKVLKAPIFWTWTMFLNPGKESFRTTALRQKFLHSLDTQNLVKEWGADTSQSLSIIPTGMAGFVKNATLPNVAGKVASTFLCKKPLEIAIIEGMPLQTSLEAAIRKEIKKGPGCESNVQSLEMGKFMDAFAKHSADIYISGLDTNSTDPVGFYRQFIAESSENYLKYNDKELNRVYEKLYEQLPNKRTNAEYEQLQRAFYATGFGIAIGRPQFRFVYSQKVKTVHMNPLGMHLNRWWKIGRS